MSQRRNPVASRVPICPARCSRPNTNSRATSASAATIKKKLSAALDGWLEKQGDPGAKQDTQEAIKAARQGNHLYGAR